MKIVAKEVEMVAWFKEAGEIVPVRFRMKDATEAWLTIRVDHVSHVSLEKTAGNPMLVFRCQSQLGGEIRPYELKYELDTCRWMLYKM